MPPIYNQGQLGSCTAFGTGKGIREYMLRKTGRWTPLSALDLYWRERNLEGTVGEDSGAYPRDGFKVLVKTGIAPEKDRPYDISTFTARPTVQANENAKQYKITSYHQITNLLGLKKALNLAQPVGLTIQVYTSFEDVGISGVLPMPAKTEEFLGLHWIVAVGYNEKTQLVTVRNSWGPNWGHKGYCYIPYKYWSANLIEEMWVAF